VILRRSPLVDGAVAGDNYDERPLILTVALQSGSRLHFPLESPAPQRKSELPLARVGFLSRLSRNKRGGSYGICHMDRATTGRR
jgi:hypothetical protein